MKPFAIVLGLAICLPVQASDLTQAFESAWARHPQGQKLAARIPELAARQEIAAAWLAAPPTASVAYRDDKQGDDRGFREWEAELGLPLWLPGQFQASGALAQRESQELAAAIAAQKLELAGGLREALWAARLADNERTLAQARLDTAGQLEKDVKRRLDSGLLARSDWLLARSDWLQAQSATLEAQTRAAAARLAYAALVGSDKLPGGMETVVEKSSAEHPLLAHALARAERSRSGLQLARQTTRSNPELALRVVRERGETGETYRNTVGVKFSLPFSSEARNRRDVAGASAELTETEIELQRLRHKLELDMEDRRNQLALAQEQHEAAREQLTLATENLALTRKAFDLGEKDLPTLLRIQTFANEAALGLARAEARLGLARARHNQASGILP